MLSSSLFSGLTLVALALQSAGLPAERVLGPRHEKGGGNRSGVPRDDVTSMSQSILF